MTSREIRTNAQYQRDVHKLAQNTGKDNLRQLGTYVPRSTTRPEVINTQQNYRTPVLNGVKKSTIQTSPVRIETQAAYRNGLAYYTGSNNTPIDRQMSYMWLTIALADGHPYARDTLATITRRMSQTEYFQAQELTKYLHQDLLKFPDKREQLIRDAIRQYDIDHLRDALREYWKYNQGKYPGDISENAPKDICRIHAISCLDKINLKNLYPAFILRIPNDPSVSPQGNTTGYRAFISSDLKPFVYAPLSELKLRVAY